MPNNMPPLGLYVACKILSFVFFAGGVAVLVWGVAKGLTTGLVVLAVGCMILGVVMRMLFVSPIDSQADELRRKYGP